jgi:UDP-2,4-diacetamido-2,4,6-trideoxy-beta-L-altropyranose hydrolase
LLFEKKMRNIAIRTDSSYEIGTGHVMRCLALAEGLQNSGWRPIFLSRDLPGNIFSKVRDSGFQLMALPPPADHQADSTEKPSLRPADWLRVSWQQDVIDCKTALAGVPIDAICVDHYALDGRWEQEMAGGPWRMIVIDDLANRPHVCDMLLDANSGRESTDYEGLARADTHFLIGPFYALLRPDFAKWRQYSIDRRNRGQFNSIVIAMGGVDQPNVTGRIISAIANADLGQKFELTVILGQSAPWVEQVRLELSRLSCHATLRVNVSDMAKILADHDLAIGGAGVMAWERCCMGLPSIVVVMAENQRAGAAALENQGAAILLEREDGLENNLVAALAKLQIADHLISMSKAAASITDGKGVERVVRMIESLCE